VQLIPSIARTARHLTVFQRTPNYVVPARNSPLEDSQRKVTKAEYPAIWKQVRSHAFAMPMNMAGRVIPDVDEAERNRILEQPWETGGFRYLFETFDDLLVNERSNEIASEFIRNKIRSIVRDPATAELLWPRTTRAAPSAHRLGTSTTRPTTATICLSST
jgi:cation diffusion facilitator CzcD-associated flavoprotein CzcO